MNQCLALIGKEVAIDECRDDVVALCLEGCRHDPEKEGGEMYTASEYVRESLRAAASERFRERAEEVL